MIKVFCTYGSIAVFVAASSLAQAQSGCTYFSNPTNCLPAKAAANSSAATSPNSNSYSNQNLIPNTNYSSGNGSGNATNATPNFGFTSNTSSNPYVKQNLNSNTNSTSGTNSNSGSDQNAGSNSNSTSSTPSTSPSPVPTPNPFNTNATPSTQAATPGRHSSYLSTQGQSQMPLIVNNNITDNGILRSSQQSLSINPNSLANEKSNSLSNMARNGALTNSSAALSSDNAPKPPKHVDDDQSSGKLNARPATVSASSALRPGSNKDNKNSATKDPKKKPTCIYLDNAEICGPS